MNENGSSENAGGGITAGRKADRSARCYTAYQTVHAYRVVLGNVAAATVQEPVICQNVDVHRNRGWRCLEAKKRR